MFKCKCGKEYEKVTSLNSHARFCKLYVKKEKKKSKYKISDDLYRCECGKEFKKSQSLNAHFTKCLIHRKGQDPSYKTPTGKMQGWDKFSETKIKDIHKKSGESLKENIKNGITKPSFLGKTCSKEHREKISKSNKGKNNGFVKTKFYEIYCPYDNKNVKVQGTWELIYAKWLNKNSINWTKDNISLQYKLYEDDYIHNYYPDFYLINSKEYIEIKGYWWKSEDGRVDDKRKMKKVVEYNKDKKIKIIESISQYK